MNVFANSSVTPITQALTIAGFAFMTLVYTTVSKRKDKRLSDEAIAAKEVRDYARLDEVERRTKIASEQTLRRLEHVEEIAQKTHGTATVTLALVNSDKTSGMMMQLDLIESNLLMMRELTSLKQEPASEEAKTVMRSLAIRRDSLKTSIADRLQKQKAAEVEITG